jgi:hypothetical protein
VRKDDWNYAANWMKHGWGADEVEIKEWLVKGWLNRAISKYCSVYGIGTPEMAVLFPWAGQPREELLETGQPTESSTPSRMTRAATRVAQRERHDVWRVDRALYPSTPR